MLLSGPKPKILMTPKVVPSARADAHFSSTLLDQAGEVPEVARDFPQIFKLHPDFARLESAWEGVHFVFFTTTTTTTVVVAGFKISARRVGCARACSPPTKMTPDGGRQADK